MKKKINKEKIIDQIENVRKIQTVLEYIIKKDKAL